MTTEALYSCNFRMFGTDNIAHQFTVRSDDYADFLTRRAELTEALLASGMTWTEQAAPVKGQYETDHIIGYIVTAIQKGTSAGQPAIACYNNRSKFAAYYLYKEDAHLFPKPWPTAPEFDGAAPEKDIALTHRKFHKLEWQLPITPRLTPDGEVEKKNGYIQYKPNRAATLDGAKKLPDVGKTVGGNSNTVYTHKRSAPEETEAKPGTCAEMMVDDERTEWWVHLNTAQQDVVSYARAFVRTYPTGVPKGVNHAVLLPSVMAELQKYCIFVAAGAGMDKPGIEAVTAYASQLLSDVAGTDAESVPYACTYWLASCIKEKDAKGNANPFHDMEWVKAFAECVVRIIAAEGIDMNDLDPLAW